MNLEKTHEIDKIDKIFRNDKVNKELCINRFLRMIKSK